MKKQLPLTLIFALILLTLTLSPAWAQGPVPSPEQFPLDEGNHWTYEGLIKWQEGRAVQTTTLTWTMSVSEVIRRRHITAYRLYGHPADLTWYELGRTPSEYLFLQIGPDKFYESRDLSLINRLQDDTDTLTDLVNESQLFLELPLYPGQRWGDSSQLTRLDGLYHWTVEAGPLFGSNRRQSYTLTMQTVSDEQRMQFVPGIGITHYYYRHHGTVSEVSMGLVEYHLNNSKQLRSPTRPSDSHGPFSRHPAPAGPWVALLDQNAGSLILQQATTSVSETIFAPGSSISTVSWSPQGAQLLVGQTNWLYNEPRDSGVNSSAPLTIWQIPFADDQPQAPRPLFESETALAKMNEPEQVIFGSWAPDGQHVQFWLGMLSASILADGLTPYMLNLESGTANPIAAGGLLSPRYQSWAPDGSMLAITAGAGRVVWHNKWLSLYDVESGEATVVVSETERIPGIVAWSPQGDLLAYAASPAQYAAESGPNTFANPAIAHRRIYLLDPTTGQSQPLNEAAQFQDAPTWNEDGSLLCYVQREDETMARYIYDPTTGESQPTPASQPAPASVGYYGLEPWTELLSDCP